ncbi:hypothetical protein [Microcystis phage Mwe-JY26]
MSEHKTTPARCPCGAPPGAVCKRPDCMMLPLPSVSDAERRVGDALAAECLRIFGACWDNDVRWRLARAAISAMEVADGPR